MALSFRVLGAFEIVAGREAITVAGARRIGVLARLALEAGRIVPTDQLVADIWGHSPIATAGKQIHIVVSRLRELLATLHEGEILQTASPGYRLDLHPEQVDAHRFASLVRHARTARARGDGAEAGELFGRALSLWRGPALLASSHRAPSFLPDQRVRCRDHRGGWPGGWRAADGP
jgi:DNA-binding SARP family transcriptional activator